MDFNHNFRKLVALVPQQGQLLPSLAGFTNDIEKLAKGTPGYSLPSPDYCEFRKKYG